MRARSVFADGGRRRCGQHSLAGKEGDENGCKMHYDGKVQNEWLCLGCCEYFRHHSETPDGQPATYIPMVRDPCVRCSTEFEVDGIVWLDLRIGLVIPNDDKVHADVLPLLTNGTRHRGRQSRGPSQVSASPAASKTPCVLRDLSYQNPGSMLYS